MPLVHPCAREGCSTLTMGELCLDHEQHRTRFSREGMLTYAGRLSPRLGRAAVLTAAAAAGALAATRLPR
jgi:hypothetical protein